jgi:hypothetical protein
LTAICVQTLVPDEEQTHALDFDNFGVADVKEFLENTADAAYLPSQVHSFWLEYQYFLVIENEYFI